ncbi:filamentous hemagglutinin [Nostoc sp. 'Peltigera membranacea cyanobiont' 210A]|uniref:beta strand repeat-containing protein n=1 Tax=Nostoc sp. 'Peltigera membranacea cyanobiont' 210A TaxID=2014529 RepID=UPI000B955388|nr:S-layer family protein [Nostoc sp. 'Peltigera membranacea cyanobiont' 210A]OYD95264.1 filamentous hemagglutinin [Nostoc sp. 'Peltigera membranacea cyanobiont' 210A]
MKAVPFVFILTSGLLTPGIMPPAILPWSGSANAQVTSDATINTTVNQTGNNFNILNGTEKGNNLFHSFSNFSVPTGGSATFNLINTPNIRTIFSRVTGGSVSNIDGLIQTLNSNNAVSLFLMNPAGIVFGANARLDIGGSFVGTTANSINFSDGFKFNATDATRPPLLTMSVPIGLQIGQNSGSIQIQGQGHNLLHPPNFLNPVTRDTQQPGLRVLPGKTLALIGNGIQLDSGALIAESGHIELGSVGVGSVNLNTTAPNWEFSYNPAQSFSDINLNRASLVDTSGNPGGSIHLQGKDIRIQDRSNVLIQHQGQQNAGSITINADSLAMSGALQKRDPSWILSENIGSGNGANIAVSVRQMILQDGSLIFSNTYNNGGNGGNIAVNATESIQLLGASPYDFHNTGINTITYPGGGLAGNISVTTQNLTNRKGGGIVSLVQGGTGGGNIDVTADTISIMDNNAIGGAAAIASSTFFGGDGGAITVNTGSLLLKGGGLISASTSDSGDAGRLTIHARESIEVDGVGSVSGRSSQIAASGQTFLPPFLRTPGVLPSPTGDAGILTITSPSIKVSNQGYIAAENVGSGNAGFLQIQANSLVLDQKGQIRTAAASGQGGSIGLTIQDVLLMRHNSLISAKAGGTGNGGNIAIDSSTIVGLEDSDIIANALRGRGGNIQINTQGIIGLQYRPQLTPENDISASSEFGVNGTVQINNIGVDPNSGLVELPANVTDPSQQIASGCSANQGSRFVATGRGGIPQNPTQQVATLSTWDDVRDLSAYRKTGELNAQIPASPKILIEATTWHRNAKGKVELIATQPDAHVQQSLTCAAVPKS